MAKLLIAALIAFLPREGFSQPLPEKETSGEAIVAPPEEFIEEIEPGLADEDDIDLGEEDFGLDAPQELSGEPLPLIKKKREKIDTRFLQNKRLIEHPNASKGLIKINKDRTYIYKVPTSDQNRAASVRVGVYNPEELENPDNPGRSFNNLYSDDDIPMLQYDYERVFFRMGLGKTAWKISTGLYIAQGNGQFENPLLTETPRERFTLLVVPLGLGLVHRFQFWDTQPIVPFVSGGADVFAFAERRDDDLNPDLGARLGAAPAAHFSFGGTIRMGRGARAFLDLDREYGINAVSIVLEYKNYLALSDSFDFSSEFVGGGVLFEY